MGSLSGLSLSAGKVLAELDRRCVVSAARPGGATWVELRLATGARGWANRQFLRQETTAPTAQAQPSAAAPVDSTGAATATSAPSAAAAPTPPGETIQTGPSGGLTSCGWAFAGTPAFYLADAQAELVYTKGKQKPLLLRLDVHRRYGSQDAVCGRVSDGKLFVAFDMDTDGMLTRVRFDGLTGDAAADYHVSVERDPIRSGVSPEYVDWTRSSTRATPHPMVPGRIEVTLDWTGALRSNNPALEKEPVTLKGFFRATVPAPH